MNRILWVAVAEARGHLMRALLMRALMLDAGVVVDIATTDDLGRRFVAAAGVDAEVLPGGFHLVYDGRQNLDRAATERAFERYLMRGLVRDLRWLGRKRDDCDLVVNDSFHPALLAATLLPFGQRSRVVNVYGEHLRAAVTRELDDGRRFLFDRALGRAREVVHTLELPLHDRMRPLIAAPKRLPKRGTAAVYLNPRFSEPRVADAIERAVDEAGLELHAVGECMAHRPRWRATDARLCDAIAAADVLIAAPGMGTLSQVHAYGTPFVALMSDQPEQRLNARFFPAGARKVHVGAPALGRDLCTAIAQVRAHPTPSCSVAAIRERWRDRFIELLSGSQPRRNAA
jgi:hypothetical protein